MNLKLIKHIKCINCNRNNLELLFFDESGARTTEGQVDAICRDQRDGIMLCRCGYFYPIISSIIRTIKIDSKHYKEYFIRFKDILHKLKVEYEPPRPSVKVMHAYDSFSYEWSMLKSSHSVWGQSREGMFSNLERQLLLEGEQLRDMIILDAGSGHGRVTSAFAKLSQNVISLEISENIDLAYKECEEQNNVLFVQGNIMNPPLADESLDIIYCAGVLHHTPNTKVAAQALMPLLKRDGRFYIWLYPRRNLIYSTILKPIRFFTSRIPPNILWSILKRSVALFDLWKKIKRQNAISSPYLHLSMDEKILSLFDTYSPRYRHTHHPEEVNQWFKEKNFSETHVLHFSKQNLDMLAIR